jgi:hypothetical protein
MCDVSQKLKNKLILAHLKVVTIDVIVFNKS